MIVVRWLLYFLVLRWMFLMLMLLLVLVLVIMIFMLYICVEVGLVLCVEFGIR